MKDYFAIDPMSLRNQFNICALLLALLASEGVSAQSKQTDLLPQQRQSIPSTNPALTAPEAVEVRVNPDGDQWQIDLLWTASPAPTGTFFVVELVTIPSDAGGETEVVTIQRADTSAATILVDRVPVGLAARVSQIAADGTDYAAGQWTELSPATEGGQGGLALDPIGRVSILVRAADLPAHQLAAELANGLGAGGLWVSINEVDLQQTDSTVAYRYDADAGFAAKVADYLPGLGSTDTIRLDETLAAPGEIFVTLVGGPSVVDAVE